MKSIVYKGQKYVLAGKVKNFAEEIKANTTDIEAAVKLLLAVQDSLANLKQKTPSMSDAAPLAVTVALNALENALKAHDWLKMKLKN